jgi:hypothetical protein
MNAFADRVNAIAPCNRASSRRMNASADHADITGARNRTTADRVSASRDDTNVIYDDVRAIVGCVKTPSELLR